MTPTGGFGSIGLPMLLAIFVLALVLFGRPPHR